MIALIIRGKIPAKIKREGIISPILIDLFSTNGLKAELSESKMIEKNCVKHNIDKILRYFNSPIEYFFKIAKANNWTRSIIDKLKIRLSKSLNLKYSTTVCVNTNNTLIKNE